MTFYAIKSKSCFESDELSHHGILGMKWGIRRFQNKDGSLTKAGEKRYNDSDNDKGENKSWSTGKKIAVGVGIGAGTAAAAVGAAYLAKKAGVKLSELKEAKRVMAQQFANEVSKEFGSIEKSILDRTKEANLAAEAKAKMIDNNIANWITKMQDIFYGDMASRDPSVSKPAYEKYKAMKKQLDYYIKINSKALTKFQYPERILSTISFYASPDAAQLLRWQSKGYWW